MKPDAKTLSHERQTVKGKFENDIAAAQDDLSDPLVTLDRCKVLAANALRGVVQLAYDFGLPQHEAITYHKEVKPYYLGQLLYYTQLYKIEWETGTLPALDLPAYYKRQL